MRYAIMIVSITLGMGLPGCDRSPDKPSGASKAPTSSAKSKDDHEHKAADGRERGDRDEHVHKDEGDRAAHGGEVVELGSTKIGALDVRASRDKVEFKPGGDAPIDVWIDGGVGQAVSVVRFWIGTEDAKGSIKAKADIEDGKWHSHVEIPSPLPAGSKLWVEVEASGGKKTLGSLDLKN